MSVNFYRENNIVRCFEGTEPGIVLMFTVTLLGLSSGGSNDLTLGCQTIDSGSSSKFHHSALLVALVSHSLNFCHWLLLAFACGASVALGWLGKFQFCHPIVRSLGGSFIRWRELFSWHRTKLWDAEYSPSLQGSTTTTNISQRDSSPSKLSRDMRWYSCLHKLFHQITFDSFNSLSCKKYKEIHSQIPSVCALILIIWNKSGNGECDSVKYFRSNSEIFLCSPQPQVFASYITCCHG